MASTSIFDLLPIHDFISKFKNFQELENEIKAINENGEHKYHLSIKELDDLCIIYNNAPVKNEHTDSILELENSLKSMIFEKDTLKPIASQNNVILYNKDAIDYLSTKNWKNVIITPCYEGTSIIVFNHNDKWYVSTRRCIDAKTSVWVHSMSYNDLFNETIANKFTFNELDKKYCYHFVIVHHQNKNIVSYEPEFGKKYKELIHIMTTEKYTLNEIEYKIPNTIESRNQHFSCIDELLSELTNISSANEKSHVITTEGYVLKVYDGEINKSPFKVLKLQTAVYQMLNHIRPNNSNFHQCCLELYQKDQLNIYLPYFTKYVNNIKYRINKSFKTITREIFNLYHITRQRKNPHIYEKLPSSYKTVLYNIHGLFINDKKRNSDKTITIHDIYYYLKQTITAQNLRQIYYDRMKLIQNNVDFPFINKTCIETMTQSTLMFVENDV